jgi:hypothetical protein
MLPTECLRYPSGEQSPEYIICPLAADNTGNVTDELARQLLKLQADAYAAHFSIGHGSQPFADEAAIRKLYDHHNPQKIAQRRERVRHYLSNGSRYLQISHVGNRPELTDEQIPGIVKFSPSRSAIARLRGHTPNLFVNDIIVTPQLQSRIPGQGKAAGATLLHAALRHGGYDPARELALHAYEGSTINQWFERIGLKATRETVEPLHIGAYELPQVLYVSARSLTISAIAGNLEHAHPQLRFASILEQDSLHEPYEY